MRKRTIYTVLYVWLGFWTLHQTTFAQNAILNNPSACGLALPVTDNNCPDAGTYFNPDRFVIRVNNAPGAQMGEDVYLREVRLLLLHSWTSDLDISLISPAGRQVVLTSDNGGGEDDYGVFTPGDCSNYTTFTMEACTPISAGEPPFTDAVYLPEESLYHFNDGVSSPNGDWILQICDDVDEDMGLLQYVELVFEPLRCLPVQDLQITAVDSTTFVLDWTPDPVCQETIIEYGPPGFTPGDVFLPGQGTIRRTTDCPPYTLSGLAPGATYEVYIRKFCQPTSSFSVNSCPVTGVTGCLPPPATIVNTFDGEDLCTAACGAACPLQGNWTNDESDGFDWLVNEGPTSTQGTGPTSDAGGGGRYLYLETSGQECNETRRAILNSHCIQLRKMGSDTCHLSFNYHMFGTGVGELKLEVTRNGGQSWQTLWSRRGDQGDRWRKTYLGLNQFPENTVLQFRFVGTGSANAKGDIALDNIVFYGSADLGASPFVYYADTDGDGFGNPGMVLRSCLAAPPAGYVENGGDCDDRNPNINPDATESPCNGTDENCNGTDDDPVLPPPQVTNDTICSGELAVLRATATFGKPIFWYASPTGSDFVGFGDAFFTQLPDNDSPVPVTHRFYAEETDFTCQSERRAEAVVVVNPKPRPSIGDIPTICPNETLDLASIEITDVNFTGADLQFYNADPPGPENLLTNTEVHPRDDTTFYFVQTTPEGCAAFGRLDLVIKPAPAVRIDPTNDLELCREDTASVRVVAQGGAGSYAYFWGNGAFGAQLAVQGARFAGDRQVYQLTVTDADGCVTRDSLIVRTTTSIDSVRRVVQNVTSCLGSDGAITVVPLDGVSPFNYQWLGSNGISGQVSGLPDTLFLENLPQGSYQLTITDSSPEQCSFVTRQILVNGPAAVVQDIDVRNVSCFGAQDGQVCLALQAGNPRFLWSTGATTPCIDGIRGGRYSVTLTEGDCETVIENIEVKEPELLRVVANFDRPTCYDSGDGAIQLSTFGGTAPYQYRWATGDNRRDLDRLNGGTYNLTVTDVNRCILLTSVELPGPSEIQINTDSIRPISCPGADDGFVKVTATGGTPPYRYEWSTGRTSPLLPQASPGDYTLSVTDFNGCLKTKTFTFADPAPLAVEVVNTILPRCLGDNTGQLTLSTSGGVGPYQYQWSNGTTGATAGNLAVGRYEVTVTDLNGCPAEVLVLDLEAQFPLTVSASIIPPTCEGTTDGRIVLAPQGTAPFVFEWADAPSIIGGLLPDLGVGEYPVRITDDEGCVLDTVIAVAAPQVFQPQINTVSPRCAGSSDGVVDVSFISAGLPPFRYAWSNGSQANALVGVPAGSYQFTITDLIGCAYVSDTIVLEEPAPLSSELLGVGPIICQGESTGFIEMEVEGGVPPYAYNWVGQNVQTKDIFNVPAGDYRLQVRDANNCPYDTTIILREPPLLNARVDLEVDRSCNTEFVSKLTAAAEGGLPPYQYRWSNGSGNRVLTDPPSGDYYLQVEDANGCIDETASVKVAQREAPIQLDTFFVTDITCRGANNGTMNARISGGRAPYRFHFSNNDIIITSNTSVSVGNLAVDNDYRVTVTDLTSGCVVVSEMKGITEPPQLNLRLDRTQDVLCFGEKTGAVFASTSGGTAPYQMKWFSANNTVAGSGEDLTGVAAGSYTGVLMDANNCTDTLRATIRNLNTAVQRTVENNSVRSILCKGDRVGSINVSISGGRTPYQYEWSNGATTQDLSNLPAGAYTLSVTDGTGCRVVFPPVQITEPDKALNVAGIVRNARCKGFEDGSISIAPSGGAPPYQIEWTHNDALLEVDILELDSLAAGTYLVQVMDQNGCERSTAFGVAEPPLLSVRLERSDTTLRAVPGGGVSPYRYFWNTGTTDPVIERPVEDDYFVTVIDNNGCRVRDSISLIVNTYDPERVEEVRLYPNPTSGNAYLEVELRELTDLEVRLYGAQGQLLFYRERAPALRQEIVVPLDSYPSGLYFLTLRNSDGILFSAKVIRR